MRHHAAALPAAPAPPAPDPLSPHLTPPARPRRCINYTNEKLQQQFIDALVKLQQEDYEREGLKCASPTPDEHVQPPGGCRVTAM